MTNGGSRSSNAFRAGAVSLVKMQKLLSLLAVRQLDVPKETLHMRMDASGRELTDESEKPVKLPYENESVS